MTISSGSTSESEQPSGTHLSPDGLTALDMTEQFMAGFFETLGDKIQALDNRRQEQVKNQIAVIDRLQEQIEDLQVQIRLIQRHCGIEDW